MAVASINKEAFLTAVQELSERGDKITQSSIRERLGNRGSFTTINDWLKEWRQQHESQIKQAASLPMIPDEIKVVMNQLWRTAIDAGKAQYQDAIKEYQDKRDEIIQEKHHLLSEIKRLQERVDGQQSGLTSFSDELNQANAELKAAQTLADERSMQINKLQTEVETCRQTAQTEIQKNQLLTQQAHRSANLENKHDKMNSQLNTLQIEKQGLILKLEQQKIQFEHLNTTHKELSAERKQLIKDTKQFEKEKQNNQLEIARLKERLNAAQQQTEMLTKEKTHYMDQMQLQMQQQIQASLAELTKPKAMRGSK